MYMYMRINRIKLFSKTNNFYLILSLIIYLFISLDDDEAYNNPNLHSKEQDELEIPDGKYLIANCLRKKLFTF
jgi:hypothetical protein